MKNEKIAAVILSIVVALLIGLFTYMVLKLGNIDNKVGLVEEKITEVEKKTDINTKAIKIIVEDIIEPTLDEKVMKSSSKWKVDYRTLRAIIKVESKDDPEAIGHNSDGNFDYGYCQVNLSNKKWLFDTFGLNCHDRDQNIDCGAILLKGAIQNADKYANGDLHFALMCYNCGTKRARELWDMGIHETDYSKEVVRKMGLV